MESEIILELNYQCVPLEKVKVANIFPFFDAVNTAVGVYVNITKDPVQLWDSVVIMTSLWRNLNSGSQ